MLGFRKVFLPGGVLQHDPLSPLQGAPLIILFNLISKIVFCASVRVNYMFMNDLCCNRNC